MKNMSRSQKVLNMKNKIRIQAIVNIVVGIGIVALELVADGPKTWTFWFWSGLATTFAIDGAIDLARLKLLNSGRHHARTPG